MKCCVCEKELKEKEAKKFPVDVKHTRLATCSPDHQKEAKKKPEHCRLNSDTAIEFIPL